MAEENVVTYVKPELCTSRSQEILQVKQAKSFAIGSDGNLKVGHAAPDFTCTTTGELRLRAALHRKALALDLSGILSYKAGAVAYASLHLSPERLAPRLQAHNHQSDHGGGQETVGTPFGEDQGCKTHIPFSCPW